MTCKVCGAECVHSFCTTCKLWLVDLVSACRVLHLDQTDDGMCKHPYEIERCGSLYEAIYVYDPFQARSGN
jgi:hypothetical protein